MTCAQGSQARLAVDADSTFDANSEVYEFLYETMQKEGTIVLSQGISGSRSQRVERSRKGTYKVGGQVAMDTCPYDLDRWLPRILGGTPTGDTFPLAEALPSPFYMLIDKVGGVFRYDNCVVNRGIFRSVAGPGDNAQQLVTMILDIMARDENPDQAWAGTIPALGTTANRAPYVFAEGVLTINGGTYPIKDFVLAIDNHLEPRWVNSLTATEICPTDRSVRLRTTHPFTTTEFGALYDLAASATGVAATLVFTMGSYSTTFTMAGLQWADNSPNVKGKQEIPLYLDMFARMKGTDRELVVTNVA